MITPHAHLQLYNGTCVAYKIGALKTDRPGWYRCRSGNILLYAS